MTESGKMSVTDRETKRVYIREVVNIRERVEVIQKKRE